MGYRKQPFGYRMQLGEIVIDETEAILVQEIFNRYTAGESLGKLTEALRQQDVPYDEGRIWNKNMVARILADQRYTGIEAYPKIIAPDQLSSANKKRAEKSCPPRKNEVQRVLRRLCGESPPEWVEREVAELLNINVGERLCTGLCDVYNIWEGSGFRRPELVETVDPDRITLTLEIKLDSAIKYDGENDGETVGEYTDLNKYLQFYAHFKSL